MITAVTTCMGRREHLEVTLPYMLDTFDKVIVVDWNCPQGSGSFAASLGASVVYKYGERYFNASKARNYGAKHVTTDRVCFVDADVMCMPGSRYELDSLMTPSRMVLSARGSNGKDVPDTIGFLACYLEAFWNAGAYDESWIGWAAEDIQMRANLLFMGIQPVRLSGMAVGALAHSNELRSVNRELPCEESAKVNFRLLKKWFAGWGYDYPTDRALTEIMVIE